MLDVIAKSLVPNSFFSRLPTITYYYQGISLVHNPCQKTLQLFAHPLLLVKSSQVLELHQQASTSQTYFSTPIQHRLQISATHVCQLILLTKYSNFIPLSSRIIQYHIFNHVNLIVSYRIKNSSYSYLSQITLFVILILFLPLFSNNNYLYIILTIILYLVNLSALVSYLNSSNSPRSFLYSTRTILTKKI